MFDQLNQAIQEYRKKWEALVDERADQAFFKELVPLSVGWKVDGADGSDKVINALLDSCDQFHAINKNDRWLTTMHLKAEPLAWDIEVVSIMERRPGSQDALGLDCINFYVPRFADVEEVLSKEPDLKWTHESNGEHSQWISIWFGDTEAKLRPVTILDVNIAEFREVRDKIVEKVEGTYGKQNQ